MTFEFLDGMLTDEEYAKMNTTTQLILFFMGNLLMYSSVCEELRTDYGIESIMAFLEKNSYNNALLGLFYYSYGHALTHCKKSFIRIIFNDDSCFIVFVIVLDE